VAGTERALRWLVVGLTVAVVLALLVTQAAPDTSGRAPAAERAMLELVNAARAERALPPLAPAVDVAAVAYAWSRTMADTRDFEHNPHHAAQICCWSAVAENIAWSDPPKLWQPGDAVERVTRELHEALLASPGHRANLLDPGVDQIGIGIHVDRDGGVWITQNFRRSAP